MNKKLKLENSRIASLKARLERIEKDNVSLQSENDKLKAELNEKSHFLSAREDYIFTLQEEIERLKASSLSNEGVSIEEKLKLVDRYFNEVPQDEIVALFRAHFNGKGEEKKEECKGSKPFCSHENTEHKKLRCDVCTDCGQQRNIRNHYL